MVIFFDELGVALNSFGEAVSYFPRQIFGSLINNDSINSAVSKARATKINKQPRPETPAKPESNEVDAITGETIPVGTNEPVRDIPKASLPGTAPITKKKKLLKV